MASAGAPIKKSRGIVPLSHIKQEVDNEEPIPSGFTMDNDILYFIGRDVLAKSSPFISILLKEYHNSPMRRHSSELKTYLRMDT